MNLYQIYFSPTGGTKKVTDLIGGAWNCEKADIDLCAAEDDFTKYSFHEEDICLVAVPSFGGRVPAAALSRLAQMKGGSAKAILLCVYGNRAYEDTLTFHKQYNSSFYFGSTGIMPFSQFLIKSLLRRRISSPYFFLRLPVIHV